MTTSSRATQFHLQKECLNISLPLGAYFEDEREWHTHGGRANKGVLGPDDLGIQTFWALDWSFYAPAPVFVPRLRIPFTSIYLVSIMSAIELNVYHRGTTYPLSLLPDSTFDALQARLEELTSVPPSNQKLLYKGKKPIFGDETIIDAGFKSGMKVQMLGSTAEEIGELRNVEDEHQRKERILRERARKPQTKVCRTYDIHRPYFSNSEYSSVIHPHHPNPQI